MSTSPRPPKGYSWLKVSPTDILLPLTISNKCGQSFRWRTTIVIDEHRNGDHGDSIVFNQVAVDTGKGPSSVAAVKMESGMQEEPSPVSVAAVKVEPNPHEGVLPREDHLLREDHGQPTAVKAEPDQEAVPLPATESTLASSSQPADADVKEDLSLSMDPSAALVTSSHTHTHTTEYSICLSDRVVLLRQDEQRGYLYHKTMLPDDLLINADTILETELWIHDYLNLSVNLDTLYQEWTTRDPIFTKFGKRFTGIRMLRQDPWECLISFICSSNNNIARIGQMVTNLCIHFSSKGKLLTYKGVDYYPFPHPQDLLLPGTEEKLRELGFGYRAKYIAQTAQMLCHLYPGVEEGDRKSTPRVLREIHLNSQTDSKMINPNTDSKEHKHLNSSTEARDQDPSPTSVHSYLSSLRARSYHESRSELIKLQGIGPKVADCILLMSLDQPSSIPVDRHVFQFAAKWYGLRNAKYENLVEYFRELWGEYAGWAHSVLFMADLRAFKDWQGAETIKIEEDQKAVKTEQTFSVKGQDKESMVKMESRDADGTSLDVVKRTRTKRKSVATSDQQQQISTTRRSTRKSIKR
ncbi:unnamed protein product [Sympodiomycopsis kandeliae]